MTDPEKTQITKLLEEIAKANRLPSIVLRGLLNGLFTAIGATIAFALVIFLFTQLYSGVRGIPFLKDIMDATGLSTVVDYTLGQVDKAGDAAGEAIKENEKKDSDKEKKEEEDLQLENDRKTKEGSNSESEKVLEE
jgi:hypothetical protein